jgi:cytoskeletal protein CcmA (bactofilin family)
MFHRQPPAQPVSSSEESAQKLQDKRNSKMNDPKREAESAEEHKINEREEEVQSMSNETNEAQGQRPVDVPSNSPYQRPMGGPAQYGYAGMQSSSMQTQSSGRRLMIGEGITLSGEIEACDHLVVEGTVEAALKGAKVLDIAESGVYYGTVEIENATIAGRFEGDIRVDGRLTVKSTGTISGTITYRELAVESGATIDGKIAPLSAAETPTATKETKASGKATKAQSAAKEEPQMTFTSSKATASA